MIKVIGPDWIATRKLRQALTDVPEEGVFHFGCRAQDKLDQLRMMERAKVRMPKFTDKLDDARKLMEGGATILGRFRNHTCGKDIVVNKLKRTCREYWTVYVPSTEEWRIHIFDGLSIARGKKIFEGVATEENEIAIRSRGNEYHMTHKVDPPEGMRDFARKMVKACGLAYGACDILVGRDGKFYGLEVNTAPAMDNYTRAAYVKAIRRRFAR